MPAKVPSAQIIERDKKAVTPAICRYTDIAFACGEGSFLFDFEGKRYYDFTAGIATMNVGHNHPRVEAAITDQAGKLIHAAAHGSTFGGNPIACRAGLESLAIIEEENLLENAACVGDHIQSRFKFAQGAMPVTGDVRGEGLMVGVELIDYKGESLSASQVKQIIKKLGAAGVVMTKCGQSTLRIAPALSTTENIADEAIDLVLNILSEFGKEQN